MKSVRCWTYILRNKNVHKYRRNMPHKRRICGPGLFVLPSLAGVSIFVFLPFADVVRRSFASAAGKEFTGLHNYKVVLENKAFRLAVGNTGKFLSLIHITLPTILLV